MRNTIIILFIFLNNLLFGQQMEKVIVATEDPVYHYISDGDSTELYYYKIIPKNKAVGVLTIIPSGGEKTEDLLQKIDLHTKAYEKDFLIIIPSYNMGTFRKHYDIAFFDTVFTQVIEQHKVSKDNFFLCGLSNGGIMSLQYAIHAKRDKNTVITPRGIIGIDPPLDMARLYAYCEREIKRNFSDAGLAEANWLKESYEKIFGGSPTEYPQKYIDASIYSYGAEKGGNTDFLTDVPILMYSDLNIDYLLNDRKRDLNDWNGIDIVAFVNQLKINGNENAEVVISQNKGKRLNGDINPHSWNILDSDEVLNWLLELVNED